jgi:hypothetical protein
MSPDSATHDCIAVPAVEAFERIEEVAARTPRRCRQVRSTTP